MGETLIKIILVIIIITHDVIKWLKMDGKER